METAAPATTLQKKKTAINRGKLKKTIKNVICRPDPIIWPKISEEDEQKLVAILNEYRIQLPVFEKLPWKDLKLMPKEQRPRQPKLQRVEDLLFGISECSKAIENQQCSAVIIESSVNPRIIVQPVIDQCRASGIPLVCLENLRNVCAKNFGIPTSCLGINKCLENLTYAVNSMSKFLMQEQDSKEINMIHNSERVEPATEEEPTTEESMEAENTYSPLLYRSNKKQRVFKPTALNNVTSKEEFVGQDFIKFSEKSIEKEPTDGKAYMKMILKRMSNNPNRLKKGKRNKS